MPAQFSKELISQEIQDQLPEGFVIRPLELEDYDRGYLQVLAELTTVGEISKESFTERFEWLKSHNSEYFCIVVHETATGRVVGSGNILIERKFIHECGAVGHIEDIVVSDSQRGKGLGKWVIKMLLHLGKQAGAYKTLLACLDKNVGFYEKCGLKPKEVSMAMYYQ
eukprot:jgi/Hompol1/4589/HPOL_003734-RA